LNRAANSSAHAESDSEMKYDIKQLKKIDWTKLELPTHIGEPTTIDLFLSTDIGPMLSVRRQIESSGNSLLYRYIKNNDWQLGDRLVGCDETEALRMFSCGSMVDEFIARELAEIEKREAIDELVGE